MVYENLNSHLKSMLETFPITIFWSDILFKEWMNLSKREILDLLSFATTYSINESRFSKYPRTKIKSRNRLDAQPDIRFYYSILKTKSWEDTIVYQAESFYFYLIIYFSPNRTTNLPKLKIVLKCKILLLLFNYLFLTN